MENNQSQIGEFQQCLMLLRRLIVYKLAANLSAVAVLFLLASQASGAELSTVKKTSAATTQIQVQDIHELLASSPKAKDSATAAYLQDYYDIIADWEEAFVISKRNPVSPLQ